MSLKGIAMTDKVLRGKIKDIHQIEDVEALYAKAEELIERDEKVIEQAVSKRISTAEINADGNLIITLADESTMNAGKAKGDKGDQGKNAYEYAIEGGYEGTEKDFADAIANVGNALNENLFSFESAESNLALLSKNNPNSDYISVLSSTYGYKDNENGHFVFTPAGYNVGIKGSYNKSLQAGSYKLTADIYIPSSETNKTMVKFGAFVAPSAYANLTDFDLGVQDNWITVEKVFAVEEGDTDVYVIGSNYVASQGSYAFYVRNVKISRVDSDKEQGESIKVKKWVVLGDSITEKNSKTTKNYHDYIAELTGINVINMGVSGTGYKSYEDSNNAFYQRILSVPANADVVTIFGSGNDLGYGYTIGEATDTGTNTLCGCINKTIDNLYSVLPTVRLGIITSIPWGSFNPADDTNLMAQYSAKIVDICRLRGIPCLDLYHSSGLRPWDSDFLELAYPMNTDGTARDTVHPNEAGHSIIAPRIKAFLESLVM